MKYYFMQNESKSDYPYEFWYVIQIIYKTFFNIFTFFSKLSIVFLTHVWIIHIILRTLNINTICMAGNILHDKGKSTYIEYYFESILVLLRHLDRIAENNELQSVASVS